METIKFFNKSCKRLIFGCTGVPTPDMKGTPEKAELLYRILETNECISQGEIRLSGLSLDEPVIRRIYHDNFETIVDKPKKLDKDKTMEYCIFVKENLARCPDGVPELDKMKSRVNDIYKLLLGVIGH